MSHSDGSRYGEQLGLFAGGFLSGVTGRFEIGRDTKHCSPSDVWRNEFGSRRAGPKIWPSGTNSGFLKSRLVTRFAIRLDDSKDELEMNNRLTATIAWSDRLE